MKILVYIDQRSNKIKSSAFEALTLAAHLNSNAAEVAAVIVGDAVDGLANELKDYGAETVFTLSHAGLKDYNCLAYAKAVETAIRPARESRRRSWSETRISLTGAADASVAIHRSRRQLLPPTPPDHTPCPSFLRSKASASSRSPSTFQGRSRRRAWPAWEPTS